MGSCPRCQRSFQNALYCPEDGAPLVEDVSGDPWLGEVVGRYRLQRLLGRGGMGAVYLGEHMLLPKRAAVKLLHAALAARPEAARRFHQEARAAAGVSHPNIVEILDFGQHESGALYLVMELLEGEHLASFLCAKGPLSPARLLPLLRPICQALFAAHERGLVHRDLKPDNVFLTRPGGEDAGEGLKLLDFGVVKILDAEGTQTREGMLLGTPLYMSPEQGRGGALDHRADLYSLGAMLYEALLGKCPFGSTSENPGALGILFQHINESPRPFGEVRPDLAIPAPVERVVLACLAKRPEDRPQSALALLARYEEALAQSGGEVAAHPGEEGVRCPSCGAKSISGARFCGSCAAPQQAAHGAPAVSDTSARQVERRQLTVLSCGLALGGLSGEELDPEIFGEILPEASLACASLVRGLAGTVVKASDNEILACFGYPLAHEDDARRAARAALAIKDAIRHQSAGLEEKRRARLRVRQGIHTGLVVVGDGAGRVSGEAITLSPRLMHLADADMILLSATTHQLVQGYFLCEVRKTEGGGLSGAVFRLCEERTRADTLSVVARVPLVGRAEQLRDLRRLWERAREGEGQVVFLRGEAGIGKSRLVQALREIASGALPAAHIECHGSPYHQNSSLYPVIEALGRLFSFQREDPPERRLSRLEDFLKGHGLPLSTALPLFATLLSLPLPERSLAPELPPQKQKQKTLFALVTLFLRLASRAPLLLIVEDAHWADPSTLELLGLLFDQIEMAPLFVLVTGRPEFHPPWEARESWSELALSRLSRAESQELVLRVSGGRKLPPEVLEQILSRTDGVPLFLEELTRMVLESELLLEEEGRYALRGPLPNLAIPATLTDSLTARLDRQGSAKEAAQLAAAIGRAFSYRLIRDVSSWEDAELCQKLARLVEAELLHQRGRPPEASYLFTHALVQEAAYQSLVKAKRQAYHEKIAQVLEERFPETAKEQPELVARHYTEAGQKERAINAWQRAGEYAARRGAYLEAISHLRRGLSLLSGLPETPARAQRELSFQMSLGAILSFNKGYTSQEMGAAYGRARELCQQLEDAAGPQLPPVLAGLWLYRILHGETQSARAISEEILALAERAGDPVSLFQAHRIHGSSLFWCGELLSALHHQNLSLSCYQPEIHRAEALLQGHDPQVFCLIFSSLALWMLGYPEQALARNREALTIAESLSHPPSLAMALEFVIWMQYLRGETAPILEQAEALLSLATEQEFPYVQIVAQIFRGWARADRGHKEGIDELRQALQARKGSGTMGAGSLFVSCLVDICRKTGQLDEALLGLDEELLRLDQSGERPFEAELRRLRGECLRERSFADGPEAEACFREALSVARRQSARMLELRAAMSLRRLYLSQGRADEMAPLAECYHWFNEGHDTDDLRAAKELLSLPVKPI